MKPGNGKATAEESKAVLDAVKSVLDPEVKKTEEIKQPEEQKPVEEVKPSLTIAEKILKVETLQLMVDKRSKLVQTRSELERFQVRSNDFNCTMQLRDSDGNVFSTSFTPGIKKVVDFLKESFDSSIHDVEGQINF